MPGLHKCSRLSNRRKTIHPYPARKFLGLFFVLLVGGLMVAIFAALVFSPQPAGKVSPAPDILHLLRMGLIQATLSTSISLLAGIALSWSLDRLRFWGRSFIISMLATAIVAPGLVIALGLISIWGRSGWFADLASLFAIEWTGNIFGLPGIILAHTVLNGTFAAHLFLSRLNAIPSQKIKLARSLAPNPWKRFAILDWPAISGALPSIASIVFLLTFTSFPIVLLLGGGPANQTLEVAIYSAVRMDFNLQAATSLALVQLGICLVVILPTLGSGRNFSTAGNTDSHHWPDRGAIKIAQILILIVAIAGFASPVLAVLQKGLGSGFFAAISRPSFIMAAQNSLVLGSISAILTLFIATRIAMTTNSPFAQSKLASALLMTPIFAYLVMPSVVLSLGFFMLTRLLGLSNTIAAPAVLIIANILLALPFVYAIIAPALKSIHSRYDKQARALNLNGFERWNLIERPLLGREIGLALALAFSFSLGDLGVISLFGTAEFSTLPWQMFRAMGAYRNNDAATIAAIMLLLSMAVFLTFPIIFNQGGKIVKN